MKRPITQPPADTSSRLSGPAGAGYPPPVSPLRNRPLSGGDGNGLGYPDRYARTGLPVARHHPSAATGRYRRDNSIAWRVRADPCNPQAATTPAAFDPSPAAGAASAGGGNLPVETNCAGASASAAF